MSNVRASGFTGRHMTAIMVAFFAVVSAVNIAMATLAVRSFGGTVVDNSYVASQRFNGWLAQARAQQDLGWTDEVRLGEGRHVVLRLSAGDGTAVAGAMIAALAEHPLGRAADIALTLRPVAPGRYTSDGALPPGRWRLRIDIAKGRARQRLLREID
ncbi:MAG: FixH family protein [Sphingobium sp.]